MNLFIKKISCFFIQFVFFAFLIQIVINIRIKGVIYKKKGMLEQYDNVNADIVLLGSSRCFINLHQLAPFFESAYNLKSVNLGVNGHSEISMAIVSLKRYLLTNKPPKFVILSFDPLSSAGNELANTNFKDKNAYAEYVFFPSRNDLPFVNYFGFKCYERYLPLYTAFKYKLIDKCFSFNSNIRSHRVAGEKMYQENWDTVIYPITANDKNYLFKKSDIGSITNMLGNLKDQCQKNHTKLICLQSPVYKSLYGSVIFSYTKEIAEELQIPFIDVNNKFNLNNLNYFYNANHINKLGQQKMVEILYNDPYFKSCFEK